jgi:hypothetical protein
MQYEVDVISTHRNLFLAVRAALLGYSGIEEIKKERITTYANQNGGLCHIRTTKTGVDVGFLKGVLMKGKFELLTGNTKKMRVLSLSEMNAEVLDFYIRESIRVNE